MILAPHARRVRTLVSMFPLAAAALALLAPARPAAAQEVPFTGVVVDDRVEVRAGPGRAYYVVDELEKGDRVEVVLVLFGWNKILAPDSSFSYIPQAFVNARGDGSVGVVTGEHEVKAGSVNGPGMSYKTQVVLSRGDRVQILGTEGDYYKIQPPEDAHVYLPPGSIRRANQLDEAAEAAAEQMPDSQPSDADADAAPNAGTEEAQGGQTDASEDESQAETQPEASAQSTARNYEDLAEQAASDPTDGEKQDPAASSGSATAATDDPEQPERGAAAASAEGADAADEDDTPSVTLGTRERQVDPRALDVDIAKGQELDVEAESEALAELEARAVPLMKKPVEEQPIAELMRDYRELLEEQGDALSADERQLVSLRLTVLERNQQLRAALAEIEKSRERPEPAEDEAAADAEAPPPDRAAPPRRAPARDFDAVGTIMASSVYDGRSLPRMFRLVDPTARRTLAYLSPADVDPSAMLGKLVGVTGESHYDPSLKLRIFEVETIEVLDGAG